MNILCLFLIIVGAMAESQNKILKISKSLIQLSNVAIMQVLNCANHAIANDGYFTIGLSGGSMVTMLNELQAFQEKTDFSLWRIGFIDERFVPLDHVDSTYRAYRELLMRLGIDQSNIYTLDASAINVEAAAVDYHDKYEKLISPHFSMHMVLLGMGPDGHTASLFPGDDHKSELLYTGNLKVISVSNSPKPPQARISMTLSAINDAQNIIFIISGNAKANIISKIITIDKVILDDACILPIIPDIPFEGIIDMYSVNIIKNLNIPASLVTGNNKSNILYLLDESAASLIFEHQIAI
jgi:6-phosphogluconolactonase